MCLDKHLNITIVKLHSTKHISVWINDFPFVNLDIEICRRFPGSPRVFKPNNPRNSFKPFQKYLNFNFEAVIYLSVPLSIFFRIRGKSHL